MTNTELLTGGRADLLETLRRHRDLLRFTVRDPADEQARRRTTAGEPTLGGLIEHVAETERMWAAVIIDGPAPDPGIDWSAVDRSNPPPEVTACADPHRMTEADTLANLLDA